MVVVGVAKEETSVCWLGTSYECSLTMCIRHRTHPDEHECLKIPKKRNWVRSLSPWKRLDSKAWWKEGFRLESASLLDTGGTMEKQVGTDVNRFLGWEVGS